VQARNLLGQLRVRAGTRERDLPDVVLDVEVRVVDPVRLIQSERHVQELATQHRHERQPLAQHLRQPR